MKCCRSSQIVIAIILPLVLLTLTAAVSTPVRAERSPREGVRIETGTGKFTFVDERGDASKQLTVYTYLPAKVDAATAPIIFVMHGHGKNADGYRDAWARHADTHGFLVIVPLFDASGWGATYSGGQQFVKNGKLIDPAMWSFSVIEHLFDAIKVATGNTRPAYYLYGHSEGGQFVHRLVFFLPEARYVHAVVANPGWYTMPDRTVNFPYGLANSPATEATLQKSLERNVTVLLGGRDIDPHHPQLRKTPEAMAQGRFRLERGQQFFRQAEDRCAKLQCRFGWKQQVVPGAAHSNRQMASAAAAVLMDSK